MTPRLTTVMLALALVGTACTNREHPRPVASPSSESPTPSPTPTPTPTPTPALLSPFTGLPIAALAPVIAVKVDNAQLARPQWGLDQADIVYEEAVEGRTTRFLAIFSSKKAPMIGPVRSVRESDMPLLRMYGRVAFAYSGGNTGVLAEVNRANVISVNRGAYPDAYTTMGRRRDAFNFVTGSDRLLRHAPRAVLASDVGFRFGALSSVFKRIGRQLDVVWSGFAHTTWKWDPTHKLYVRYMDGRKSLLRNGHAMTSPNVVIQYCTVRNSRYSDVHGVPSPYTTTTGRGRAVLLRDGRVIVGTWQRDGFGKTHFRDSAGHQMLFRPGPVWIMLVPNDLSAVIH